MGIILAATIASPRTILFGDLVTSYRHFQRSEVAILDTSSYRLDQADLGLVHHLSDWNTAYLRMSMTGTSVTVSEAYLQFGGLPYLPYNGEVTAGKFYKPQGSPIPIANLSFPAMIFHANPEVGVKANFSSYPVKLELGMVNGNPIAGIPSGSARIGGTPVLSHINDGGLPGNVRADYYGRIALAFGEDWGSLTTGVTYTGGNLDKIEVVNLNPRGLAPSLIGAYTSADMRDERRNMSFDFDYEKGPVHFFGEYMHARDGRLRRDLESVAGAYTFYSHYGKIVPTVAYDVLDMNAARSLRNDPRTWDRNRVTASLAWWPMENIQVLAEYEWNSENVRRIDGGKLKNDQFVLQNILYF